MLITLCPGGGTNHKYRHKYSSSVWDPSGVGFQDELEKVQNRAGRFATGNYNYDTGIVTGILEHLKWESLKNGREAAGSYFCKKV